MSHEQSETIQNALGKWINVYGRELPDAGKRLPGSREYDTVQEAVAEAIKRSKAHDHDEPGLTSLRSGARTGPSLEQLLGDPELLRSLLEPR